MKRLPRRLVLGLAIGLISACADPAPPTATGDGAPARGGTVVVGGLGDVLSWNPYLAEDQTTVEILSLVYPSLAVEQVDYQDHPPSFAPSLATGWELSADGLELTFRLHPRARWSDGVPVTAEDVAFTFRTQRDPDVAWLGSDAKDAILEVAVVDAHTVRFRFDRAYPYQLIDANEGPIIPAHAWGGIPYPQWRDVDWGERVVSAGPFRKSSHRPQQDLVLERSDGYWRGGRPYLDRVIWRPMPSRTPLLTQLLMRGAISRQQAGTQPPILPGGTGAVGARWARGWTTVCLRWRCREATCTWEEASSRRAAARPVTSPNGTGTVGARRAWE